MNSSDPDKETILNSDAIEMLKREEPMYNLDKY